jgi:hypothetical protein
MSSLLSYNAAIGNPMLQNNPFGVQSSAPNAEGGNVFDMPASAPATAPVSPTPPGGSGDTSGPTNPLGKALDWWDKVNPFDVGGVAMDATKSVASHPHPNLLEDIAIGFIGLLLIAAGIFAFKETRTVIQTGGRLAGKAATIAAA